MVSDHFQLAGHCLAGKFRVDSVVAEDSSAIVYAGQQLNLDRAIAIKVLKTPSELNKGAVENFIANFTQEAKTFARLSHPNIVQVIDFGVSRMPSGENQPWMVLEWLTGRSLEQDLQGRRGRGGRTPAEALSLLEPIFDALEHAHEEGIAHRDVKPANIMIVSTKRGEMLKLDFGIVKIMEKGEVAEKDLAPTRGVLSAHSPTYAAPEQVTGLRTGPWTDVHALGLLLTEVLTDFPPYQGKDITTLLRQVLSSQRPTPACRRVDAGPWEPVLAKALALVPSDRFRDAKKFLAALKSEIPSAVKSVALEPAAQAKDDDIHVDIEIDLLSPVSPEPAVAPAIKPIPRKPVQPRSRKSPRLWLGPAGAVFVFPAVFVFMVIGYLALSKPRIHQPQTQQVALDQVAKPRREKTPAVQVRVAADPVPAQVEQARSTSVKELTPPPLSANKSESTPQPVQARVAADPVPAQDEQVRSASVRELTPPPLSANKSESTPPLATIQGDPPSMLETETHENAAKKSTPPNPQAKSNLALAARLRKQRSKPKHIEQRVSTVRREQGLVSAPTLKPVSTEQPAPNRRGRSSNKPLQQTNIELE